MRLTATILILIIFIGCASSDNTKIDKTVYSPPDRTIKIELDEATITTIKTFRDADFAPFIEKAEEIFNPPKSILAWQPGFLVGAEKATPTRKLEVIIFESHELALKAVNTRNENVSSPKFSNMKDTNNRTVIAWNPSTIEYHMGNDDQNGIKNWWYSDSPSLTSLNTGALCIVKGNMIISLYDNTKKYSEIEDELWNTANYCIELLKTQ